MLHEFNSYHEGYNFEAVLLKHISITHGLLNIAHMQPVYDLWKDKKGKALCYNRSAYSGIR
jgi:hypothetical protein